jgi:membrane-associated protease RseP (regulator of RpoE activity)
MAETAPPSSEPRSRRGPKLPWWFNHFLFGITCFTTFGVGFLWFEADDTAGSLVNGLIYMATVMGILLGHEMGHYVMARRNRVPASLPYFLPIPPVLGPLGTAGAVIVMRGRIRSRNALMEVGAAGPLAGIALTIPLLLLGLSLSPVIPIPEMGYLEGQSLLYLLLKRIAVGPIPEGHDVLLHPVAWAGWLGLLVTMINLMPVGQLDGGHIFYALFGDAHAVVSRLFHRGLFLFGLGVMAYHGYGALERGLEGDALVSESMAGLNWIVWGALLLVFFRRRGLSHPPTDDQTLSSGHRAVGIACLVVFVLTFTPVPLKLIV